MQESLIDTVCDTLSQNGVPDWVMKNLLSVHYAGSKLYGLETTNSDLDIRGVFVAPLDYVVGAKTIRKVKINNRDLDLVLWEVRHFADLCLKGSPNVVETLFVGKEMGWRSDLWSDFPLEPKRLLSKNVKNSFLEYSNSQLKKSKTKTQNGTGRASLIEKHGYDTKFVSHAFRLLYELKSLAETDIIKFPIYEVNFVFDIKNGKYNNFDYLLELFESQAQEVMELLDNSSLADKIDANPIMIELFDKVYKSNKLINWE